MRALWIAAILAILASSSWAQPPETITPDSTIELGMGESKTLRFHDAIKSAGTVTKDIALVTAQSDRTITITGIGPGETTVIAYGDTGQTVFLATISVAPSRGQLVKVYGLRKGDFIGVYCNETGCGRPDLDKKLLNGGRDPDEPASTSVTETVPTGGGGFISKTDRFGR